MTLKKSKPVDSVKATKAPPPKGRAPKKRLPIKDVEELMERTIRDAGH